MLKHLIALLVVVSGLWAANHGGNQQNEYIKRLHAMIDKLAKPYGLEESIKAIVAIESANGKYKVNLQDPSCGITHVNINTYIARHKIKDTPFMRNKACSDLVADDKLSIVNSIEELLFWKRHFCGSKKCSSSNWKKIWAAYNGGWNYNKPQPAAYADKIASYIRTNRPKKNVSDTKIAKK